MRKITLTEPLPAGTYTVEPRGEDEIALRPDTGPSEEEMLASLDATRLAPEEARAAFGDLPADREG